MSSGPYLVMILLLLLLQSCGPGTDASVERALPFQTLDIGSDSPLNQPRSQRVINSNAEYEALFSGTSTIDFDRTTVLAVFLGNSNNGGYGFEITAITERESSIAVTITWTIPRTLTGTPSAHYHVVALDKKTKSFLFTTREVRE